MTDKSQKTDILLAALSERYESLRTIRERAQNVGLTALGLLLGAGGWLIQSQTIFSCYEKASAIGGLLSAIAVLRFLYLRDLRIGFQSQQRVASRIEKALQLYQPGAYIADAEPLYPVVWANAGTEDGTGNFFRSIHVMIYVAASFLIVCIIVST